MRVNSVAAFAVCSCLLVLSIVSDAATVQPCHSTTCSINSRKCGGSPVDSSLQFNHTRSQLQPAHDLLFVESTASAASHELYLFWIAFAVFGVGLVVVEAGSPTADSSNKSVDLRQMTFSSFSSIFQRPARVHERRSKSHDVGPSFDSRMYASNENSRNMVSGNPFSCFLLHKLTFCLRLHQKPLHVFFGSLTTVVFFGYLRYRNDLQNELQSLDQPGIKERNEKKRGSLSCLSRPSSFSMLRAANNDNDQ